MKKIMFNDRYGLTQAVIEGRKTMTRRLVPWSLTEQWIEFVSDAPSVGGVYVHESEKDFYERETPRYKVGEIVAVAQNYFSTYDESKWENGIWYNEFADGSDITNHAGWINKMFVKAEYMPHQIRITGIRCERLQDISDEDCMKEGVLEHPYRGYMVDGIVYKNSKDKEYNGSLQIFDTPREAFAVLIDKVSGRGTWKSNPWVVVYEFELVK
ncbi:hypothetical protein [Alistipes finegoldii]|jgi:hypothetical protein|uniref:hypothetical protein n=1 Tax=Alistipes finegoldii TaxID=214856 RepID=UPI0028057644|nr:hypothetical protein [uncultured Alistipes sp.]